MLAFDGKNHSPAPSGAKFQSRALLLKHGLRATRQRRGLATLLFGKGDRHVTVEALALEANAANMKISLATVYNVLNLFARQGLIRSLATEGDKTIFDTNVSSHSHFFFEDTGEVRDVSVDAAKFLDDCQTPEGYEISKIDIVIRLRPKTRMKMSRALSEGAADLL